LQGHISTIHDVAFSRDGRYLATANENGAIYILKVPPPPSDGAGK